MQQQFLPSLQLIIWNASTGEVLQSIDAHGDVIYDLSFSRNGSKLATTSKDRMLRVFESRTGQLLQSILCHEGHKCVKVCEFSRPHTPLDLLRSATWAVSAAF